MNSTANIVRYTVYYRNTEHDCDGTWEDAVRVARLLAQRENKLRASNAKRRPFDVFIAGSNDTMFQHHGRFLAEVA